MNKKIISMIFLMLCTIAAFSSEIIIGSFLVYDADGNKIGISRNPSKELYSQLEKNWFDGIIHFSLLPEGKYFEIVSVLDANKVCSIEGSEYLIYGFLKKNENNWFADIKLYSSSEKKIVKEFFSMDDIEHYDRMFSNLTEKVLDGIEELSGLKRTFTKNGDANLELKFPISLYYWAPIDKEWSERLLGVIGINAGTELYLPFPYLVFAEKKIDFSARLNFSWEYGMNKQGWYSFSLNTISVDLPLFIHLHFNKKHSTYIGGGLGYSYELMNIRPKYEKSKLLYRNLISLNAIAGYEVWLNEYVNLFSELSIDTYFANDSFILIKPCIGISIKPNKE